MQSPLIHVQACANFPFFLAQSGITTSATSLMVTLGTALEDPRVIVTLLTAFVIIVSIHNGALNTHQHTPLAQMSGKHPLKLVCLSDTHGLHKGTELQVPDGDWLVFAGDAGLETELDVHDFNTWLGRLPHRQKLVVFGNMDFWGASQNYTATALSNASAVLLNTAIDVEGYRVVGSPNTPKSYGQFQLMSNKDAAEHWAQVLPPDSNVDIMVTHGPPFGLGDSVRGKHAGDAELSTAVKSLTRPPMLWVVGHIHEGYGVYIFNHGTGPVPLVNAAVALLARGVSDAQLHVVELPSGKIWRDQQLLRQGAV